MLGIPNPMPKTYHKKTTDIDEQAQQDKTSEKYITIYCKVYTGIKDNSIDNTTY